MSERRRSAVSHSEQAALMCLQPHQVCFVVCAHNPASDPSYNNMTAAALFQKDRDRSTRKKLEKNSNRVSLKFGPSPAETFQKDYMFAFGPKQNCRDYFHTRRGASLQKWWGNMYRPK